ncbi:PREDICTED: uncharacterized protein LOC109146677 [Ipomoea nil]|uniref:uncharacterized protein LOC109146677 n=1 Tax=Ipomoea nil TaxID=35883 RepID=UPI0009011D98|nr:PREDICTED: uncharacterized protein LOC109146677 [Ipomoea nil]
MVRLFLEKFFPASRAASIRREICGIKQRDVETLHEYWERFKQLCASCPQHGVSEQLLIQYFYEGLLPMERNMMDAASGGAIVNKTPRDARDLISIMAANSQQFGFSCKNVQQVKACGICAVTGHPTDMCPTLQYNSCEDVNAVGGFPGQPQRNYDPYSNTYNPGWRDHPNFSYKARPQFQQFQPIPQQSSSNLGTSLEDIVKSLATNTQQFQQETRTSIQHLESQVSQLASTVSRLESQGKLPSQTIVNPKQNAQNDPNLIGELPKSLVIPQPFPSRLAKSKKNEEEKEILETFRKVEVNIHLLDAIKQIPRYAKFLKELCTNKRKLKGNEMVSMGENVSAILQKKLPPKCKDPGMFAIPCKIGNINIERAMLDLEASINVMPLSVYSSLNVGPLKEKGIILQLADRSNVYPRGVLEDILVQVQGLVFSADFYVVDMEEDNNSYDSKLILLGRPFLKTTKSKIDVHDGTLTMEFDGEIVKFDIFNTSMKHLNGISSVFVVDILLQEDNSHLIGDEEMNVVLSRNSNDEDLLGRRQCLAKDVKERRCLGGNPMGIEPLSWLEPMDGNSNHPREWTPALGLGFRSYAGNNDSIDFGDRILPRRNSLWLPLWKRSALCFHSPVLRLRVERESRKVKKRIETELNCKELKSRCFVQREYFH